MTPLISVFHTVYRRFFSPALHLLMPGFGCRFVPTCSHYAVIALRTFPLHRALFLIGRRILRCHPWHDGGVDWPSDRHAQTSIGVSRSRQGKQS